MDAAERFEAQLPKRISLELGFDQSENVAARLDRLTTDFAIAIALVAITLLPLGLRAAGVVMISIPLSLAIGVSALHLLGFSLNQISIAGFVVALGLLVDDSIVVVENIARFLREGHTRMQAAILATRQIFQAILGCTATIMFAFLPLMMISGDSGKFIRVLPTAVLVTVAASLARRADDHPVPREPHAEQARGAARQSPAAMGHEQHSPLLPAAAASRARAAAPHRLGFARRLPRRS